MSNYTKATNFTSKDSLPSGNSNKIIRGSEIDTELTAVASAIASKADSNSPTFTGTPAAPTAASGTSTTQLATTAFVAAAIASASFPSGAIVLWSGSILSIPSGWYLCDGTNSTPNLTDKFIVGAGSNYAVAATGGSADAIVVSHTHTATSTSEVSDPGHSHSITSYSAQGNNSTNSAGNNTFSSVSGVATQSASTGVTVDTTTSIASSGSSGTNANLPPYYALAYIMKA